ncbi:hypothetical protein LTR37_011473 [Vermiconidia calcicola]|uniref:Uncharacterized protein n=1 Tax=Vermiconidia calcicola TaxID=1690605 RepID=A0ACC3N512_9PEZI|nr:hypothetical protein LTR37_011473 [Vermiconidia calcicola]
MPGFVPPTTNTSANYQPEKYRHPCPYPDCPKVFACPHNVTQHVREKHTLERPHQCTECCASFPRPWGRNRHMKMVHNIDVGPGRGGLKKRKRGAEDDDQVSGSQAFGDSGPDSLQHQMLSAAAGLTASTGYRPYERSPMSPAKRAKRQRVTPSTTTGLEAGPLARVRQWTASSSQDFDDSLPAEAAFGMSESVPSFTSENFIPKLSTCVFCSAEFDMNERLVQHFHNEHGLENGPDCTCMVCIRIFRGQVVPEAVIDPRLLADQPAGQGGVYSMQQKSGALDWEMQPQNIVDDSYGTTSSNQAPASSNQLAGGDRGFAANDLFTMSADNPGEESETLPGPAQGQQESYFDYYQDDQNGMFMGVDDGVDAWLNDAQDVFDGDADMAFGKEWKKF